MTCDSAFGARPGLAVLVALGLVAAFSRFTGGLSAECSLPRGRVVVEVAVVIGVHVSQPLFRGVEGPRQACLSNFKSIKPRGGAGKAEKARGNGRKND